MIQFFKICCFLPGFYNIHIIYMSSMVVDPKAVKKEEEPQSKPKQELITVSNDNPYINRRVYSFTLHGCGGNVQIAKTETKDIMTNFDRKDFVSLKEIAEIVQLRVKEWMKNSGYYHTSLKQQDDGKGQVKRKKKDT